MPIMFNTILVEVGLSLADVRLLRHKDQRAAKGRSIYELWRDARQQFDLYQSTQKIVDRTKLSAWGLSGINLGSCRNSLDTRRHYKDGTAVEVQAAKPRDGLESELSKARQNRLRWQAGHQREGAAHNAFTRDTNYPLATASGSVSTHSQ